MMTIFYKSAQLLAYADDIDIICLKNHAVTSTFSRLGKKSERMGLVVNEDRTEYLPNSQSIRALLWDESIIQISKQLSTPCGARTLPICTFIKN